MRLAPALAALILGFPAAPLRPRRRSPPSSATAPARDRTLAMQAKRAAVLMHRLARLHDRGS